jgi:hypothetical protein
MWLAVLGVCLSASGVSAEPVTVSSGYLEMRGSNGPLLIGGNRGFTFDSSVSTADGVFAPAFCNGSPLACVPGATVDLTAIWVGSDLRGTASLNGRLFTGIGSASGPNQIAVHFSGSLLLPASTGAATSVSAPFQFDGTFDHAAETGSTAHDTLTGSGMAIVSLAPSPVVQGGWSIARITYVFGSLPAGWVTADVGNVGIEGQASGGSSGFTIDGAGADVWGAADGVRFTFQRLAGDGSVVTRVDAQRAEHPYAKAGLMLRDGIGADAAHVILDVKPNGEIEFMTRAATGGQTTWLAGAFVSYPTWLKLQRSGTLVTAFYGSDGRSWTPLATTTLSRGGYAGLIVSSHDTTRLSEADFSGSAVTDGSSSGLPSGWTHADVGIVGRAGSATFAAPGTYTVTGAGSDIWGDADAFQFVFQPVGGTARVVARVQSLQNTHTFAKAGIMIRDGVGASAPHVILDMRPSGEVEFMSRTSAGGQTTYHAGAFLRFPGWLMLERSGSTFVASVSDDGQTWQQVGSITNGMPASANGGLVVSSHDATRTADAVFDSVSVVP